ncbi:outer membrane protein TolC [Hydrogenivirga caldilitoris]|uniref:Outer membrane protein TolC n=1 Tax=Hydrogenivirga caldilitoris TaxID=246264 RepID=A0A497XNL6_9AQUI|nr:TolC family protein [Hydrogenivirga caldilitoris]RLJ70525.1 outer membrane protein TolC [Hydrogenivirga caldilitoris]
MAFLLILMLVSLSLSQELPVLGPKKAVEIALENNREIGRIKNELLSLEDLYRAEKWDRFSPKVDLFVDKDGFNFFGQVLLLDFGNRLARIRSVEISTKIKRELLEEFKRQVKIKTVKLFMDLALAEKLAEVKREEMAVAYVRFDRERERLERGLSDRVKVAEWEATYRRFRTQLMEAQRKYNETLYELKRFLGIDVDKPLQVKMDELLSFEVPENKTIDTDLLKDRYTGNYLLKVKELEVAYFESRAKEEKRILYPELYAYLEVKNKYEHMDRFKSEGNVVLRIPLFDGRSSFFRERSFLDLKRAVEVERKDVEESIKRDILKAPYLWEELYAKYQDAVTYDRWAQENLDLSRSNYELELAFDLGYAMSTKTEAERRVMQAKFEMILFLMRLYDLLGEDPMKVFEEKVPFFKEKVEEI